MTKQYFHNYTPKTAAYISSLNDGNRQGHHNHVVEQMYVTHSRHQTALAVMVGASCDPMNFIVHPFGIACSSKHIAIQELLYTNAVTQRIDKNSITKCAIHLHPKLQNFVM